jgi:flagellar biosynthesis protein FlhB
MADDKSEQPTPKRLKEARQKGQVAKSSDLTQAGLFVTAATVLSLAGGHLVDSIKEIMVQSFRSAALPGSIDNSLLLAKLGSAGTNFLLLVAPVLGTLMLTAFALNFLQLGGFIFSTQVLTPKFDKLNPVQGFQNIFFKSKTYLELVKNLIKLVIIFWVAYISFRDMLRDVVLSARVGLPETAALASKLIFALLFKAGGTLMLLGAADFFIQKKLFMKTLKMSKEEVKKEYKEEEGDPHIKHQRKHLHHQILAEDMVRKVPQANVVVVNPTHLAIAVQYNESTMVAPQVIAKGQLKMAQAIIDIAKRSRIPVVRNVALAHSLIELEVDTEIPEELYEPVAEILNWVYETSKNSGL